MATYAERVADYERRKAEGTLQTNPFAGVARAFNQNVNPLVTVPNLWRGAIQPELAAAQQRMYERSKRPDHIYGDSFITNLLGPREEAPRPPLAVATPAEPFGMLRSQGNAPAANANPFQRAMEITDEWYKDTVAPLVQDKPAKSEDQTPVQQAHTEAVTQANEAAKANLKEQGATEEDLSAWDKFTEKFDLMQAGFAMLRGAGPGSSFWQDLGAAGQVGLASARSAAAEEAERALEERRVAASEVQAQAAADRVEATREAERASRAIRKQEADAATTRAEAAMAAAMAPDSATVKAQRKAAGSKVVTWLQGSGLFPGWEDLSDNEKTMYSEAGADAYNRIRQINSTRAVPVSEEQVIQAAARLVLEGSGRTLQDPWFGAEGYRSP